MFKRPELIISLFRKWLAASVVIDPKEINGVMVNFFACECLNGTRTAVSSDGTIVIPLPGAPSPPAPPRTPPPPRFPPSRSGTYYFPFTSPSP